MLFPAHHSLRADGPRDHDASLRLQVEQVIDQDDDTIRAAMAVKVFGPDAICDGIENMSALELLERSAVAECKARASASQQVRDGAGARRAAKTDDRINKLAQLATKSWVRGNE